MMMMMTQKCKTENYNHKNVMCVGNYAFWQGAVVGHLVMMNRDLTG